MRRLDKRVVVASGVVLASVAQIILAAVAWQAGRRTAAELAEVEQHRDALANKIQRAQEEIEAGSEEVADAWYLPSSIDVAGTMQRIQEIGNTTGVVLPILEVMGGKTDGVQTFRAAGSGRPDQVCAFLAAIEAESEVLIVESGKVAPGTGGAITFDIGIASYFSEGRGRR